MKCVYVAGAYNGPNVLDVLDNMRRGMHLAYGVLKAGYAPFCPWLDYQFTLIGPMTIGEYHGYSMAWLEKADAVLVVEHGWEKSQGTLAEIARARELGIPVFFSMEDLRKWDGSTQR